jgi:hypothetical protein
MKKSNPQSAFPVLFVAVLFIAFGPGQFAATAGNISLYDWGDAPDPMYPTLALNNGANHLIAGPWLGDDTDAPDPEADGQPNLAALGDDVDGNDDEDGVSIPPLFQGQPGDITLEVSGGGGIVQAWIDFDGDGIWQAGEQIYDGFLPDGTHIISFSVPDSAAVGGSFARFRISMHGGLGPEGPALDGEVEDHRVSIDCPCQPLSAPTPTGPQFIRGDANNDNQVDTADAMFLMSYLSAGGPSPECMDAADADDSGTVDTSDVTLILNYTLGAAPPPPPFPDCGPDPTDDSLTCDKYDLCPGGIPVTPQDTKWLQLPDVTNNGIDIRVDSSDGSIRTIADDFECLSEELITDIHLWCSWKDDVKGNIKKIHVSIHADDPPGPVGHDPENEFSKPAPDVLWSKDFFAGQFQEGLYYKVREPGEWWWDPLTGQLGPGGDTEIWQIDIDIAPDEAFLQRGSLDNPVIYWLDVQVDTEGGEFGWKTRRWPDHYMDDAVYDVFLGLLPYVWRELRYPETHPYHSLEKNSIDMAFCLTYTPETPPQPTTRPVSPTHCPVVQTQCPPMETECSAVRITECPPTETTCPALLTQCPVKETQCPPDSTRCPRDSTRCPRESTKCPPIETRCPARQTECPEDPTRCPQLNTACPTEETRCPVSPTKCPRCTSTIYPDCPSTIYPDCPSTIYPDCPSTIYAVICLDGTEGTENSPVTALCPAIEVQCPSIVPKHLLTKAR